MNLVKFLQPLPILCLLFAPLMALGLPGDRDQPIHVTADQARKNDKTGITVYKGDVLIQQGSIRVNGDNITIYDDNGKVQRIVATGQPATFRQTPQKGSEDVIAKGNNLEYVLESETLKVEKNAELTKEGNITKSEKITYDMKTTIVTAGDSSGNPNSRVSTIIQPK